MRSSPVQSGNRTSIERRGNSWAALVVFNGSLASVGAYPSEGRAQLEANRALHRLESWERQRRSAGPLSTTDVTPDSASRSPVRAP